jgi:tRNA threonylcarbamoyladenosine biosynthesis protein TsaB
VVSDGEVVHEALLGVDEKGGPQHTTALLAELERGVEALGGWDAVGSLAVGRGPGSFTGLRVGIATARGVAASRALPLAGVSTLDALGSALAERAPDSPGLALIDARRGELFWALYEPGGRRRWDPGVGPPDALAQRLATLDRTPLGAGSGAVRFRQDLANLGVEVPDEEDPVHRVSARHICALAGAGDERGEGRVVEPIYLRAPDAERWRERNTFQTTE